MNEKKEQFLKALQGSPIETACNAAGISRLAYNDWYWKDASFRKKVDNITMAKVAFVKEIMNRNGIIDNEER